MITLNKKQKIVLVVLALGIALMQFLIFEEGGRTRLWLDFLLRRHRRSAGPFLQGNSSTGTTCIAESANQ